MKIIDVCCVVALLSVMIYWNTPWYQSGELWMHESGARIGDFIYISESDSSLQDVHDGMWIIFCYHHTLIVYCRECNDNIFSNFGIYRAKGR